MLIVISAGLFLFSLTRQCYCTTNQCGDAIIVFLLGWLGLIYGGAVLTWLANPLIILSWILTRKQSRHALLVSVLASLICLSFLLFDTVIDDESGHYNTIVDYKSGYWFWTFSAVTMVAGNLYLRYYKGLTNTSAGH